MYRSTQLLITACVAVFVALTGCTDDMLTAPTSETILGSEDAGDLVPSDARSPVRLMFDKEAVDFDAEGNPIAWEGTVEGDIEGDLRTELTDLRESGNVWHVRFDWIITADNPGESFTADLSGILNLNTGRVVMNGRVVDGYLKGARVHEEGQLVDPGNFGFEGLINIMPATAQ